MKIRCVKSKLNDIRHEKSYDYVRSLVSSNEYNFNYVIDKVFQVYGFRVMNGFLDYYIVEDDSYQIIPRPCNSSFFKVLDNNIPDDWQLVYTDSNNYELLPKEWAEDETLVDNADEGIHYAVQTFVKIRDRYKKYDIYQDENLKIEAKIIEDKWIQCKKCLEVWQNSSKMGVLTCPNIKCNLKMNNPFAKKYK